MEFKIQKVNRTSKGNGWDLFQDLACLNVSLIQSNIDIYRTEVYFSHT